MSAAPIGHLRLLFGAALAVALVSGCFGTESTPFPPGLEPWDPVNAAEPPVGAEEYPEALSFARLEFYSEVADDEINSVHARGYIRQPMAEVWAAALDPQTIRDPVSTVGFRVQGYDVNPEYDYSYQTWHRVDDIVDLEWQVEWRLGVVEGSDESPTIAAIRWQKVEGSTVFNVLEGSLVLQEVPGEPDVTEVLYQYHLDALFSGYGTIEDYLNVIFPRLRVRAYDEPLEPSDCPMCAPAPEDYLR